LAGNNLIIHAQPSGVVVTRSIARIVHDGDADHQPRIGDAGLGHLNRLDHLESLDLEGTDVTSQGIAKLSELSHLTNLCVRGTNVSDAAIAELKRALPRLKVERYFPETTDTGLCDRPFSNQPVIDMLIDYGIPGQLKPGRSQAR